MEKRRSDTRPGKSPLWKNLFVVWVLISLTPAAVLAEGPYRYSEKTGDTVSHFIWEIQGEKPVTILSNEKNRTYRTISLDDGRTMAWEFEGDAGQIQTVRHDNTLQINGNLDGKTVAKTENLDDAPWFQALSYSLRALLQGNADSTDFWIVRPDDLSVHKMNAVRNGRETLVISGNRIETVRVKVRLAGAMSLFWHVQYWFRSGDLLLVKYEGVHGPPGTVKTVILLEE
ncbi:hypothetical protein KKI24_18210 [bacterium]|nr:hypothetical protein [bacterium]